MPTALLDTLQETRARNVAAMQEILTRAEAEKRSVNREERTRFDRLDAEVKEIDVRRDELQEQAEREARAAFGRSIGHADALEIRAANRLQRGQTMGQFMEREARAQRAALGASSASSFNTGAYLRGMVTGQWRDGETYERRAMAEGTVSTGGAVVPIDLYSNIVDIVRNSARVIQAGATIVPLDHYVTNVAKLTADPTPAWRAEGSSISATGSTFSRLTFTTQTLAAVVVASRELLEDVPTLGDEIAREMGLEFALGLDLAALYGTGYTNNQPQGLKNATWAVPQTSMGTNGATFTSLSPNAWMGLVNPAYRLLAANEYGLSGAIMNPRTEKELVTSASTINTFAEPPSRLASIGRHGTAPLEVYSTNQVPVNLTQGTSSAASDLFVGDWSQLLIGMRKELKIDVLDQAYAGTGQIGFLGWLRADIVVARPSAFDITIGIL